jgi:hypothetical protein
VLWFVCIFTIVLINNLSIVKKLFFLAAFAVFGLGNVTAQVTFGAKAGVNLASINGDYSDDKEGLTSFHVGGVAKIEISEFSLYSQS